MQIPMVDLKAQYRELKNEIDAAIKEVIDTTAFILGPGVEQFEASYAHYHGVKHCIGVSNGTDALRLALKAAGIGEGDEVITTCHTFGATIEAICDLGARPVFVDIEPDHFNMDVRLVESRINSNTRAILPVHLYGHVVDMDPLLKLAGDRDLMIIEDAAQSHGARYKSQLAGTLGMAGCFSFYPGKNLGAYGEAGGIITNDDALAEKIRMLRNHGLAQEDRRFNYQKVGFNNRMDGFQGAVLNVKLPHLDRWNELRRQHAERYRELLGDIEQLILPFEATYADHVYHLFVLRVPDREDLAKTLGNAGIATGVQYPIPVPFTPAFTFTGWKKGSFPICESLCHEIITLPLYPELTDRQAEYIAEKIRENYC